MCPASVRPAGRCVRTAASCRLQRASAGYCCCPAEAHTPTHTLAAHLRGRGTGVHALRRWRDVGGGCARAAGIALVQLHLVLRLHTAANAARGRRGGGVSSRVRPRGDTQMCPARQVRQRAAVLTASPRATGAYVSHITSAIRSVSCASCCSDCSPVMQAASQQQQARYCGARCSGRGPEQLSGLCTAGRCRQVQAGAGRCRHPNQQEQSSTQRSGANLSADHHRHDGRIALHSEQGHGVSATGHTRRCSAEIYFLFILSNLGIVNAHFILQHPTRRSDRLRKATDDLHAQARARALLLAAPAGAGLRGGVGGASRLWEGAVGVPTPQRRGRRPVSVGGALSRSRARSAGSLRTHPVPVAAEVPAVKEGKEARVGQRAALLLPCQSCASQPEQYTARLRGPGLTGTCRRTRRAYAAGRTRTTSTTSRSSSLRGWGTRGPTRLGAMRRRRD